MRKLYLLALLLGLSATARAQTVTAPISSLPTAPDSIPRKFGRWYVPHYQPSPTVADTAGALVALFAAKRRNTWWFLPLSVVGAAMLAPGEKSTNGKRTETTPPEAWQYAVGIPVAGGGVAAIILRLSTYSRERLSLVQHEYELGKPIPATLRHKLKPRHFADAAILRTYIVQQLQLDKLRAQRKARR